MGRTKRAHLCEAGSLLPALRFSAPVKPVLFAPRWLWLALLVAPLAARAPTGSVGIGTTPDASAVLDVRSTSQGLLLPRLTAAQRAAIASPAQGLQVFQTDGTQGVYYYTGVVWVNLTNGRVPDATGSTVPANGALVSTLAGTAGSRGSSNGTAARFNNPAGVSVDAADYFNYAIQRITPVGVVR